MTWPAVEQVCGSAKSFGPEARRHGSVKEECAEAVVESSEGTLSLAILLASVGAREAEVGAVTSK